MDESKFRATVPEDTGKDTTSKIRQICFRCKFFLKIFHFFYKKQNYGRQLKINPCNCRPAGNEGR